MRWSNSTRFMTNTRGTVLIVAMWIVLILAGLALVFGRAMRVEAIASGNHVAALQADTVAHGALQLLLSKVDGTDGTLSSDEENWYEAVQIGEGYFWILKPNLGDDDLYTFGIRDEASRINLNSATNEMLLELPNMTAELAASIQDWRDEDSEVTPGGAENEYYLLLSDPYYCKNGPFETIEEFLLVKGASQELLFAEDANLNGVLDPNENDADEQDPNDDRDSRLDRGAYELLTVYSREPNQSADGEERIDVNQAGSRDLSELLQGVMSEDRFFQVMDRVRSGRPFRNALDFHFRVGLTIEEFKQIADRLAAGSQETLSGMVNVNTAPREVLLCLPGLEESEVDLLIAKRSQPDTNLANLAWVAEVLPQEKAVMAGDLMTTRSFQFLADIVAVSRSGRAFRRYRAVVDARTSPPRVLLWKDLTHLGWPLDPEILSDMRAGSPPEASLTFTMSGVN